MSCCCTNTYKFCDGVSTCNADDFKKMFKNLPDGNYTVQLDFLGGVIDIKIAVAANVVTIEDPIVLNEQFTYLGKVTNDLDSLTASLIVDDVSYDCFEFHTVLQLS